MNFVYIIRGIKNNKIKYYIGYTNNLYTRIRRHNRQLVGGAKSTYGYEWTYCGIISHISSKIEALQIEWRLKHSTKKTNIINRINSFSQYIDTNLKASPNGSRLKHKLFFYLNYDLLPRNHVINNCNNIIFIKTYFHDIIIDHISSN